MENDCQNGSNGIPNRAKTSPKTLLERHPKKMPETRALPDFPADPPYGMWMQAQPPLHPKVQDRTTGTLRMRFGKKSTKL